MQYVRLTWCDIYLWTSDYLNKWSTLILCLIHGRWWQKALLKWIRSYCFLSLSESNSLLPIAIYFINLVPFLWGSGHWRKLRQSSESVSSFERKKAESTCQIFLQASASRAPVFRLIRMSLKSTCQNPQSFDITIRPSETLWQFPGNIEIPWNTLNSLMWYVQQKYQDSLKHQRIQKRDLNMSTCVSLGESQP